MRAVNQYETGKGLYNLTETGIERIKCDRISFGT